MAVNGPQERFLEGACSWGSHAVTREHLSTNKQRRKRRDGQYLAEENLASGGQEIVEANVQTMVQSVAANNLFITGREDHSSGAAIKRVRFHFYRAAAN